MTIPFKKTLYDAREADNVQDALLNGTDYTAKVKTQLSKIYGTVFLTASGSAAFDLLFAALDLPHGSDVIMPSFTFPSCASAAMRAGLKPVFADIDEKTIALSIADVKKRVTATTRCIIPTHYGGSSADLDELRSLSSLLIEDAALSFGAAYRGKPLGTVGDMGILSFHRTKNISADEGGMLIINSNNDALIKRIQTIYDNGTDKADFLTGRTASYTWQCPGMNVAIPNISAAVLFAQLQKAEDIKEKQLRICDCYRHILGGLAADGAFSLPRLPAYNSDNGHVFYLVFNDAGLREHVRHHLAANGIAAYFHYQPLHAAPMGMSLGYSPDDLPVTQSVSARLLRLPVYADLRMSDCEKVAACIKEALCG